MAGPQCCTPGPRAEHCCEGKEETFGPFLSYVTSHHSPTAAVLLASDIFGFETPLLRKFADKTASAGYFVVVPDFFNKDPFTPTDPSNIIANLGGWVKNHEPVDSVEGAEQVIEILHKKGFSSVGAVGFCWGAKLVVEVAKQHSLKAAILAHPAFVVAEDIQDVKIPLAIMGAEEDELTPPVLIQKFAEILESKPEVESFVHVYAGVSHGWICRYDPDDAKQVADAELAQNKIFEWLGKFLH